MVSGPDGLGVVHHLHNGGEQLIGCSHLDLYDHRRLESQVAGLSVQRD